VPFLSFFSNLAYFVNAKWALITLPKTAQVVTADIHSAKKYKWSPDMLLVIREYVVDNCLIISKTTGS
jgi:hypothetical protein